MCGLVGVFGGITADDKKAFRTLLYVDAIRGHHSTGVINASNHRKVVFHKKAMTAIDFLESKQGEAIINKSGQLLAGHNRYATQGEINSENAHPFQFDNIVGMHNGTLRQQHLLPDHRSFEVDSENIYHSMNKIGVRETISKLSGAAALVWWDDEAKQLNIWRNSERTLYLMTSKDQKRIMWASEKHMLLLATHKDRVKFAAKEEWNDPFLLKEEHHLTVTLPKVGGKIATRFCKVKDHEYVAPSYVGQVQRGQTQTALVSNTGARSLANLRKKFPLGDEITIHNLTYNTHLKKFVAKIEGEPAITAFVYVGEYCPHGWVDELSEKGSTWKAKIKSHVWRQGGYDVELDNSTEESFERVKKSEGSEDVIYYIPEIHESLSWTEWWSLWGEAGCNTCTKEFVTPDDVALWDHGVPYCPECQ